MKRVLVLTLFLAFGALAAEPDGTILDRSGVEIQEKELAEKVTVEAITYVSDGLKIKGFLARPKAGQDKLPCIIYNRGGNRDFGAIMPAFAGRLLGTLAARGYVVAASQYRGSSGSEGQEEFGGAEVNDILNLIPLLEKEPRADAKRIGMYGWSRGGMMAYLVLARSDRIRAAVIGAGMADSFDAIERRPEMKRVYAELVPNWKDQQESALIARSPIRWAEKLNRSTPILLLHGTSDWRVHPAQALRMANRLLELKHPFRLVLFEGGDHALNEWRPERNQIVYEFLDRYVRDGKPWPSMDPHGE